MLRSFLFLLPFLSLTTSLRCLECIESQMIVGVHPDPALSTCSARLNSTTCYKGCFTMRVAHGGFHYNMAITNHMVHRGCSTGSEDTICEKLNSHLDPLTVGEVNCRVETCNTDNCNENLLEDVDMGYGEFAGLEPGKVDQRTEEVKEEAEKKKKQRGRKGKGSPKQKREKKNKEGKKKRKKRRKAPKAKRTN